jgi:hypothetical protein
VFSGGTYDEVARWLGNFTASHAKRVHPGLEAEVDAGAAREGVSYGVRLRQGSRRTATLDLAYHEVADQRGSLAWCAALAERVRALADDLTPERGMSDAQSR